MDRTWSRPEAEPARREAGSALAAEPAPAVAQVLALQRSAGNQAVASILARNGTDTVHDEPELDDEPAEVLFHEDVEHQEVAPEDPVEAEAKGIVKAARDRIGQLLWAHASLEQSIKTAAGDDDQLACNCWDGVLLLALRAKLITLKDIHRLYGEVAGLAPQALTERDDKARDVNAQADDELQHRPPVTPMAAESLIKNEPVRTFLSAGGERRLDDPLVPNQLEPGQIVFIEENLGDMSHVALATTADDVVHLWTLKLALPRGLEEVPLAVLVRGYVENKLPVYLGNAKPDSALGPDKAAYEASAFGWLKRFQNKLAGLGTPDDLGASLLAWVREVPPPASLGAAGAELVELLESADGEPGLRGKALAGRLATLVDGALVDARVSDETNAVIAPYLSTVKVSVAWPQWGGPEPAPERPGPLRRALAKAASLAGRAAGWLKAKLTT